MIYPKLRLKHGKTSPATRRPEPRATFGARPRLEVAHRRDFGLRASPLPSIGTQAPAEKREVFRNHPMETVNPAATCPGKRPKNFHTWVSPPGLISINSDGAKSRGQEAEAAGVHAMARSFLAWRTHRCLCAKTTTPRRTDARKIILFM